MRRSLAWTLGVLVPLGIIIGSTLLLLGRGGDRAIAILAFLPGIALVEYFFGLASGLAAVFISFAWFREIIVPGRPDLQLRQRFASENEFILLGAGLIIVMILELLRRTRAREMRGALQLRQLLSNIADAAFVFDLNQRLVDANPAAFRLVGKSPRELMGRTITQYRQLVQPLASTGAGLPQPTVEQALMGRSFSGVRASVLNPRTGRRRQVIGSGVPLRAADGAITGALLLMTDVTELAELQQRMADLERHEAISRMAVGITHDFNNILEVVRKAAAILDMIEERPASERRRYREMIHNAVLHGAENIRRLREHLTGVPGEMAQLDLNEVVREAVELTAPLWKNREKLKVNTEFGPLSPVWGSPIDLRRAVTNLLFNAFEALDDQPGTVIIHTEQDTNRVLCWVQDSGPGIAEPLQKEIFRPFHTTKEKGSGLGLFSAQRTILAHGGNLTVQSRPGRGARFVFDLPIFVGANHASQPADRQAAQN